MIGFIGAIMMFVCAVTIATKGMGVMVKCINVLFDRINDGLDERLNKNRRLY